MIRVLVKLAAPMWAVPVFRCPAPVIHAVAYRFPGFSRESTGTGKELISCANYNLRSRRSGTFETELGAIPSGSEECEVFGHEKGTFTGP